VNPCVATVGQRLGAAPDSDLREAASGGSVPQAPSRVPPVYHCPMTRFSTNASYDIARASGRCASTGVPIEPGSAYVATLCERDADEGFDRIDFSLEAWERGNRPPRLFSSWRTTMPEAARKSQAFVDDDVLLNLFHRLADDQQAMRIAYRFVIALILLRKRLLKHDATTEQGGLTLWMMRLKGDPPETPPIEVIDPRLTSDQVREVSDQLGEILRGEL